MCMRSIAASVTERVNSDLVLQGARGGLQWLRANKCPSPSIPLPTRRKEKGALSRGEGGLQWPRELQR
jgi:hypothetical protein